MKPTSETRDTGTQQTELENEVRYRQLQLHWILQITKAINYNMPSEQLFAIYEFVLKEQMKIGKLALFMHDENWKCILSYGNNINKSELDIDKELISLSEIQNIHEKKSGWLKEFDTIIPVFHKEKPLAYAIIGDIKDENGSRKENVPFIQTITNIIVVAIENKKFAREQVNQAAIKRELELAARMQTMLFPASLPPNEYCNLFATYLPNQEVGGDYYDYFPRDEFNYLICMADVSGKGMAAALLMSNFQAHLQAYVHYCTELEELIIQLNKSVFQSAKGEKFITFFIAHLDFENKKITYINAGHNPPLICSDAESSVLELGTTGLGMFETLPFINHGTLPMPDIFTLLLYTDGVVEVENPNGEQYGLDRLRLFIQSHAGLKDMQHMQQKLISELNEFRKDAPFLDDITLLSLRTGN